MKLKWATVASTGNQPHTAAVQIQERMERASYYGPVGRSLAGAPTSWQLSWQLCRRCLKPLRQTAARQSGVCRPVHVCVLPSVACAADTLQSLWCSLVKLL